MYLVISCRIHGQALNTQASRATWALSLNKCHLKEKQHNVSCFFSAVSRNKQSLSWFPVSNYLLFSQLNLSPVFPSLKWRVVTMSAETCNLNNAIWFCGGENKTDHLFLCLHPHVQFTASSNSLESRWDRYTYGWLDFPECDLTLRWLLTVLCLLNCPFIHGVWP